MTQGWLLKKIKRLVRKIKNRLGVIYPYFLLVYRYRVYLTGADNLIERSRILGQSFWRAYVDKRRILFYPDGPREFHALYKLLLYLGYRVSSDPGQRIDIAIKWWLAFDGNPHGPQEVAESIFSTESNKTKVLNIACDDISKKNVNAVFDETFGYSISVDPRTFHGKCVRKSDWNALHLGEIIDCPFVEEGGNELDGKIVYQKLVRNEVSDGLVEDMRVPIFGDIIPFVYLKYRTVDNRFVDRAETGKKAVIAEASDVMSEDELNSVRRFCAKLGMEYGELDILRDSDDGRIYIVDANNTPSGPTIAISEDDGKKAVVRLAHAFENAFGG